MADLITMLSAAAGAAPKGYEIQRSLRFNSADSAYLDRTPASAGNRKTWTWSGWVKRAKLNSGNAMLATVSGSAFNYFSFGTTSGDQLQFAYFDGSTDVFNVNTSSTSVYRDVSAWYHIVLSVDTTQATSTNRVKIYVNGVQQTTGGTYPTQNYDTPINNSIATIIGGATGSYTAYLANLYLTEVNFIDGQALTPSSFGEVNPDTGVWQPKKYAGTYGTNGFYLNFSDNSDVTASTLGKDYSGNGNNWTPNNFSVSAGAGNDSLVDVPTPFGTDTGAGGEVRGNYATLNPNDRNASYPLPLANGNLQFTAPGGSTYYNGRGTMVPLGKTYIEVKLDGASDFCAFGFQDISQSVIGNTYLGVSGSNSISLGDLGFGDWVIYNNGTPTQTGITVTSAATLMFAYDPTTRKVWFGVNGTWYNSGNPAAGTNQFATLSTSITYIFAATNRGNAGGYINFGQRPFAYTAPSGFKALVTTNLPEGTITTSGTFTGNGSADGPFVYLNGVPTAMTIDGNAVTFGTHADKLANGFKVRTSNSSYNQNATSKSYTITTTGAKFKFANAQPNP